jgi:DNA-binding CsgD family transcriptional regulator/tetratricopeptide (TPR) repeat protein
MTTQLFVGRDRERERIRAFVRPDTTVAPSALILVGEAGIGKSALWSEGIAVAHEERVRVLRAAPTEAEALLSFSVLGDLFADVVTELRIDLPLPQRQALEIALLLREAVGAPIDVRAVGLAVTTLLTVLAQDERVMVAIDDLQWVDPGSAATLSFALRRLSRQGVRLLATARIPWVGRPEWGWPPNEGELLNLDGLSLGAIQRLVTERLGLGLGHVVLRRIHEAARGNPLHSLELARAVDPNDDAAAFHPGLELSGLVLRRLGELEVATREVLLLAAVAGQPTPALLRAALDRPVAHDLAAAARAEMVALDGERISFRHPLYAEACKRLAGAAACRDAHQRLAAAAEDHDERVRHLALAATGPEPAIASALDHVALAARVRGAPGTAADLAALATRLTPEGAGAERTWRVSRTARYLADAGDTAAAEKLLDDELIRATPGADRCRVLLVSASVAYDARGVEAARSFGRRAVVEAGEDPLLRAEALLSYAERSQLQVGERRELAAEALATLRGLDSPPPQLLSQALREVALADYHLGDGLSQDLMREAIVLEQQVIPPPAVAWRASTIMGECLKYVDHFDEADLLLRAATAQAEQEGDVASLAEIGGHRAELALWLGDWDLASRLAQDAVASARQAEQDGRLAMALHYEAMVAAHRGEIDRARSAIHDGESAARRAEDEWVEMLVATDAAFLDLSLGDFAAASDRLTALDRTMSGQLLTEPRQWRYLGDHVQLLAALGRTDAAVERLGRLRSWGERSGGWGEAMARRASAHVFDATGDTEAALAAFDAAEEAFARMRLPFPLARCRYERGALLRRSGRRRDARESLESAHAGFVSLGALIWVGRCVDEQARLGGRAPSPDGLTAAEEAVARIVAQGGSNKEVATALSISPRTVEVHLGRIYRKLGVRTRVELAARYR